MTDDRDRTGRRPKIMGDDARALAGRRNTPPRGFRLPDFHDEDGTQPPQEPPMPESIDGYEQLPEPLQAQVRAMHNVLREHDVALTRVWDARHVRDEITEMREIVATLIGRIERLGTVPALLQSQAASIAQLVAWKDATQGLYTRLEQTMRDIDSRTDAADRLHIRFESTLSQVTASITELRNTMARGDEANTKEIDALKTRVNSLEHTRTAQNAKLGMLAATFALVFTALGWVVNRLWK